MKLLRQIIKFFKAWVKWRYKGSPRRSEAEIKRIFEQYCEPCGHYHPLLEECTICECSVSSNPEERNKIVYLTEECPDGQW